MDRALMELPITATCKIIKDIKAVDIRHSFSIHNIVNVVGLLNGSRKPRLD
jgi:hypothetical protein